MIFPRIAVNPHIGDTITPHPKRSKPDAPFTESPGGGKISAGEANTVNE